MFTNSTGKNGRAVHFDDIPMNMIYVAHMDDCSYQSGKWIFKSKQFSANTINSSEDDVRAALAWSFKGSEKEFNGVMVKLRAELKKQEVSFAKHKEE